MASAAAYNRGAIGKLWNLADLPPEWAGYHILLNGDLDSDLVIDDEELDEIDWIGFSDAVADFQLQFGIAEVDGKLGPSTLKRLRQAFALAGSLPAVVKRMGDLTLRRPKTPFAEPAGPPLTGRNAEERAVCNTWNRFGGAIGTEARARSIPARVALAVFFVESSGKAHDPATQLVVVRFEPHVFRRRSGRSVAFSHDSQADEWASLERAYALDKRAALASASYGLPQLMGFNAGITAHGNARELLLAFQDSCVEQVRGFFDFVEANALTQVAKREDWETFTSRYNGPGNVAVYSARLRRAIKVIDTLIEDGANFA